MTLRLFLLAPHRARARQALVVTALGVMALAAIIVSRQAVGYRRGSSNEVSLAQDPFVQELSALHTAPKSQQQLAAQRSKAEQLLAKARNEMKSRGPEIEKLLKHSAELDARLASQEKAEQRMADAVKAAQSKVDDLKSKSQDARLHMTIGWPQKGGAMPTTYPAFDGASSLQSSEDSGFDAAAIAAAGKAIAEAFAKQHPPTPRTVSDDDEEGGVLSSEDLDNGVDGAAIRAAAARIAQFYADKNSDAAGSIESGSAEDWSGDSLRPNRVQRTTSRHGEGADDEWSNWQRREENMGFPSSGGASPYDYNSGKPDSVIVVDGTSGVTEGSWNDNPADWWKGG